MRTLIALFLANSGLLALAAVDPTRNCTGDYVVPVTRTDTTQRVADLRTRMNTAGVTALIIPSNDEHGNEYVGGHDKRRVFISGFMGSAGTAVVTLTAQALWTDGRYFLQAENELDCNWWLMRSGNRGVPSITEWLKENLKRGDKVGADPKMITTSSWKSYVETFRSSGIDMDIVDDLVGMVWDNSGVDRDPQSNNQVYPLSDTYAGLSWQQKISVVKEKLAENKADAVVVSALDAVAWLFNLRGSDIAYNPVFFAYAIVYNDTRKPRLYLRDSTSRLGDQALRAHLGCQTSGSCTAMEVKSYNEIDNGVRDFNNPGLNETIWIPEDLNFHLTSLIENPLQLVTTPSPLLLLKAVKNSVERDGMRASHLRDSAAIIMFVSRLEDEVNQGVYWDELKVSEQLKNVRTSMHDNKGLSFGTIAGSGRNGAIIHYSPANATNNAVNKDNMLLLDSGGQYLDGTTDITRTFHFGEPTDFQKLAYTLVLKGVIDLVTSVFPANRTLGSSLDTLARQPMWRYGLDYGHGTGHGIGMFLNVHEGPARISGRRASSFVSKERPIYDGMFFSDEPGYYDAGRGFGIRLETIMMATYINTMYSSDPYSYLTFEAVALVPFEPKLIDLSMLDNRQRTWLNDYHQVCRERVGNFLREQSSNQDRAVKWLEARTKAVPLQFTSGSGTLAPVTGLALATLVLSVFS